MHCDSGLGVEGTAQLLQLVPWLDTMEHQWTRPFGDLPASPEDPAGPLPFGSWTASHSGAADHRSRVPSETSSDLLRRPPVAGRWEGEGPLAPGTRTGAWAQRRE